MKRIWLLFAQSVTVLLAALFVVATLKPEWLDRRSVLPTLVPVVAAISGPVIALAGAQLLCGLQRPWLFCFSIIYSCVGA